MLVRKEKMECPICDIVHDVEEHSRTMKLFVKGQNIEYEERYLLCRNTGLEFQSGKMVNENVVRARKAFH
jgi:hypothetical protein